MLLGSDQSIRGRLMRFGSRVIPGALILAIAAFATRLVGADSGNAVPTIAVPATMSLPRPRGGIEGVVRDEKGRPIAGARLDNFKGNFNESQTTLTDKNGHYALDDLRESSYEFRVLVRAPGRGSLEQEVTPGPAGKPARVDFTLPPGHVLRGRVVDENGQPIAGVQVAPLLAVWRRETATQTGSDGRIEIGSLPADAKFEVFKSGYTKLFNVPLKLDSSGLVTVVLQPAGVICGRVVDAENGQPLAHFSVWLSGASTGQASNVEAAPWDPAWFYPGKKITSGDGTFTIPDLTNKVAVEVSVAAAGHTKCVVPVVVARPLNEAKPVTFALARIEPRNLATIAGRVLDHKGRPLGGAILRLIVSSKPASGPNDFDFNWLSITSGEIAAHSYCDQFLEAVSDSQGRFEFKDVLPGKHWQLAYWGTGVPRDRVLGTVPTAPGPAPSLTIKLPQAFRVVVAIDRAKYPAAWQLGIQLRGSDILTPGIELRPGQSKVEIKDLAPGDYDLHLCAKPSFKDGGLNIEVLDSRPIHLGPGETKEVRF